MIFFSAYNSHDNRSIRVKQTSNATWKKKSSWLNIVNSKRNVNQRRHCCGPFFVVQTQWSKRITSGKKNYGRRSLSRGILKPNSRRLFALYRELTSDGIKKKQNPQHSTIIVFITRTHTHTHTHTIITSTALTRSLQWFYETFYNESAGKGRRRRRKKKMPLQYYPI